MKTPAHWAGLTMAACVPLFLAACSGGGSPGAPSSTTPPSASSSGSSSSGSSSSGGGSSSSSSSSSSGGSSSSGSSSSGAASSGSGVAVSIDISAAVTGAAPLNPAFVGLSWEKGSLSSGLFASTDTALVTLFRNLGASVLRIGGSSVNKTSWDDSGDANGQGMTAGYVAPSDVDRLAAFAQTSGWKVIYGINFATASTAQMASEAAYAQSGFGGNLLGFELGNEPDLYYNNGIRPSTYSYSDFLAEWNTDAAAIRGSVPAAVLTGPASAYNYNNYTVPFAGNEAGNIALLTQHYYIGPPSSATIPAMLANHGNPAEFQAIAAAAAGHGISGGARLAEANSYYSSGEPGVSDSFASALWAIDFLFSSARYGVSGVNFHSGGSAPYSPIHTTKGAVSSVQPEYYGLWLFSQAVAGGPGTLLSTTVNTAQSGLAFYAYAVQSQSGGQAVMLLNDSASDATVQITQLKAGATSASLTAMTAPSLSDTTGADVRINGASFNTDGSWTTQPAVRTQAVSGGSLSVDVPAGSALLVKVH